MNSRVCAIVRLCLLLVGGLWAASCQPAAESVSPDTVYLNANVYTVDPAKPWAEAFAIRDGRFQEIGSQDVLEGMVGADTEVVDLGGRFVMPGVQDAHIHTQMAAEFALNLAIDPEQGWEAIAEQIRAYAADHPDRQWILGGNLPWLTETIGDNPLVPAHRSVLDELAPNHAIALWDVGGHAMLANTRALELVAVDDATASPVGGTIERDRQGAATGVLRELATNLILENATGLTVAQYADGIEASIAQLSSLGVTSINEVWTFPNTLAALKKLDDAGRLNARVVASIAHPAEFTTERAKHAAHEAIAARDSYSGNRIEARYVKFVLDGSAGGQTLVLVDPYVGSDFRGELRNPRDEVLTEVARLHGEGIGSVLHAVGDGAIRLALDAVQGAVEQHGANGVRHVISHTVFVHPDDLPRFAELGVIAEFSPYFWLPSEGQEILRGELGEERLGRGFPVRSLSQQGVAIAAGSDWPVVFDPNPFPAIEAMVHP